MQKYIISLILALCTIGLFGQGYEQKLPQRQTFIRTGVDLSRFILPVIYDEIDLSGFEVSLDGELKNNLFPTFEFGMNKVNYAPNDFNYNAEGAYFRLGMNYNMLKYQHRLDRNIFYVGARFGFTKFHQQADNIILKNEYGTHITAHPKEYLNQSWMEGVIGLRGEIFKNFFMGYTIRMKIRLSRSEINNMEPYFVPGYGNSNENFTAGMSYSLFYAIPIIQIKD